MSEWTGVKNILCIRPDNMGDVIMSGPAIRALKETFGAKITLLTSSMAKDIVKHLPDVDEAVIFDMPWVKNNTPAKPNDLVEIADLLKHKNFDAAVIFTVYSQSSLPSAMLAYMAGITTVLAYCRENPYGLISHWVPDKEPYEMIKHQVRRDLDLVKTVGATTNNEKLYLKTDDSLWRHITIKFNRSGIPVSTPWIILHAGVSEKKRQYPEEYWVDIAKNLINDTGCNILFTGSNSERNLTDRLQQAVGAGSYSVAGLLALDEFIYVIKTAPLVVSVNTSTVHIAAAMCTPVVVLYAQTNPQHTPWMVPHKVLPFSIAQKIQSKNEVIAYVNKTIYNKHVDYPSVAEVMIATIELEEQANPVFPSHPEIPNENPETAANL
jgi:lipopolysaccharide heptosyltransferase II